MSMFALIAILALAAPPAAAATTTPASSVAIAGHGSCFIVYGDNWAFMAEAPKGWLAACGDQALQSTVFTLWPSNESPQALKTIMYVTVSSLGHDGLDDFVKGDIETAVNRDAKSRKANVRQPPMHVGKVRTVSATRRLVHFEHDSGDRDELVEYIKGPTAYFIVALSTLSPAQTARYRGAFQAFLKSFSPMTVQFEKGAKPPSSKH